MWLVLLVMRDAVLQVAEDTLGRDSGQINLTVRIKHTCFFAVFRIKQSDLYHAQKKDYRQKQHICF